MLLCWPAAALAGEGEDLSLWEDELEVGAFEEGLTEMDRLLDRAEADFSLRDLWQALRAGEGQLALGQVWSALLRLVLGDLAENAGLLARLLTLALLAGLLTALQKGVSDGQVARLVHWVVYLLLLTLALVAWKPALDSARQAVELLRDLLLASFPLLLPLLAALGGLGTVTAVSPLLFGGLELLAALLSGLVFPLVYLSAILRLLSGMTERFSLTDLAQLMQDLALGTMTVLSTVFLTVLGFLGLSSASGDGLAVKAMKSASSAFVPVVGRTLADALDSVLGTALLLKNAVGLVGAVGILLACALPAVRLLAQALLFRLAGGLLQPLGEKALCQALSGMGKSLTLLFAVVAVCGLCAFFTLALLVAAGSWTMMMR